MTPNYGELFERNVYTTSWSSLDEGLRKFLADSYIAGGSSGLAVALQQVGVQIPINTVRGKLVQAGVKVAGDTRQLTEHHKIPRLYEVNFDKEFVKVVYIGDEQVPFNDKRLTAAALSLIRDFEPDILVELGDTADCYSVSRFIRDPRRRLSFSSELDRVNEYLSDLDDASKTARLKIFHKGNHEARLENFLLREAPSLVDLPQLKLENLLKLTQRGYEVFEYGQSVDFRGFVSTHGWHVGPNASERMGHQVGRSGISGHNHQTGSHSWTDANGVHQWFINGTLMAVDEVNPDYAIGIVNWSQGISLGYFAEGNWTITQVVSRNGKLVAPWGKAY